MNLKKINFFVKSLVILACSCLNCVSAESGLIANTSNIVNIQTTNSAISLTASGANPKTNLPKVSGGMKDSQYVKQANTLTETVGVKDIPGKIKGSKEDKNSEEQTKTSPKVSIIIPVYNCEKYLDECISSALNQTLEEIEVICVNDGSKDGSLDILKKYQEKDDRVIVIDKKNAGVSAARNDGIKAATGEYIEFMDGDDRIDAKTCETAYNTAVEKDADIVCFGWKNFTDDGSKPSRKDCKLKYEVFSKWQKAKKHRASIMCWNKLYRRSMLTKNKLQFNSKIKIAEDECFNLCVYPFAKKIVHISESFYNYRLNPKGAMHTVRFWSMIKNYKNVWAYVNKFYKSHKIVFGVYNRLTYFTIYQKDFLPAISPVIAKLFKNS